MFLVTKPHIKERKICEAAKVLQCRVMEEEEEGSH
jgi:hypothetical protein